MKIISRKRETALESTILLAGLLFMVIVGVTSSTSAPAYQFVFDYVLSPGGSTIFSLLAFYIASAAYRAFRVRSTEATVMLISAVLVMLGRVPIGKLMGVSFRYCTMVHRCPQHGHERHTISTALGTVATSVVLLGIEEAQYTDKRGRGDRVVFEPGQA